MKNFSNLFSPLSHFYKKYQFFRDSFSNVLKYSIMLTTLSGGERMIMLITRIYAVQSNTDLNKNLGIRFKDDDDEDCCFDISLPDMPKICLKIYIDYNATSSTRLTSRTCEPARSSRTGIRSRSSLSWASENQLLMGTACCGWNIYEVGELSIIIVSLRSRPTWERS